ncbi:MAG: MBOAT family protein [Clostridia bacterium]|nr:MBOAT family protein [Clostridia bacterium]MBR6027935.1 MBOAT family protein [Clostridia bacterium]
MSFDTPGYVLFLCTAALLYRLCPRQLRRALLLISSIFFYACWSLPLTLVIASVVLLTYVCAHGIQRAKSGAGRKLGLAAAVSGCVGLLIWFKYFNFLADALASLAGGSWTPWIILLPVGCSFYTFQAMSYVIDVYRGRLPAVRHLGRYALYICFFPQLVAGPIERADALLPQLTDAPDPTGEDTVRGLKLLLSGFFRKLVIADLSAPIVNRVFAMASPDGSAVFLGLLLFSFQIYCDFAGYSDIARGSALLMGIRLRRNFDRPYLARTVRAFWRRWHMSLTAWFTDYVYISLGGSRKGKGRQIAATLTVFLLSGLWHGANWTFVAWGLYHGLLCVLEILLGRKEKETDGWQLSDWINWVVTGALVLFSWLLFRAESLGQAGSLLSCLFSRWDVQTGLAQAALGWTEAACLTLALAQLSLLNRLSRRGKVPDIAYVFLTVCVLAAWFVRAAGHGAGVFIYFQF